MFLSKRVIVKNLLLLIEAVKPQERLYFSGFHLIVPDPTSPVFGATRARSFIGRGALRRCCNIRGSTTSPQFKQCRTTILMSPVSSFRSMQVSWTICPWHRRQIIQAAFWQTTCIPSSSSIDQRLLPFFCEWKFPNPSMRKAHWNNSLKESDS